MPTYKNCRVISYETLLFDTPDGDLDIGEYALDGNGTGYYIRTKSKTQGNFEWIDLNFKDMAGNVHSIVGLTLVKILSGNAYYDEFLTAAGVTSLVQSLAKVTPSASLSAEHIIRVRTTKESYDAGRYIKDTPVPSRDEIVAMMPPAILGIPPEKQYNAPLLETINEFLFQKSGQHHSIGFDATSNTGDLDAVTSYSWNHTCGASANLLAFGDSHRLGSATVSTVEYNAVAMTYIRTDTNGTYARTTIYYLLAPTTGSAKSVAVTLSSNPSRVAGGVVSYSGARQSGQPDAHNGANGANGNKTVAVVTIVDNCWVFDAVVDMWGALACGNTERWNIATNQGRGGSDTNAPKTPPGSQTMVWTGGGAEWAISAASFAPLVVSSKGGGMASKLVAAGIL